jgi:hypothetical protein
MVEEWSLHVPGAGNAMKQKSMTKIIAWVITRGWGGGNMSVNNELTIWKREEMRQQLAACDPEVSLEKTLTKHSFVYPDICVAKCSCGWVNDCPTSYSEAWRCWTDHILGSMEK